MPAGEINEHLFVKRYAVVYSLFAYPQGAYYFSVRRRELCCALANGKAEAESRNK